MGIPEAAAVVDLTLKKFDRLHLLEVRVESSVERQPPTRRWLLERGLVAAMLPAVYTILTPSPLEAQSPGGAPALSGLSPNQGTQGTTVAVTLTGAGFVTGATTVAVSGAGVSVSNVVVGSATSLTASFVLDPAAAAGTRSVTVATTAGTSGAQPFTVNLPPAPGTPTLTSVSPNEGVRGTTDAVTLSATNFVVGATTVNVGAGMTVTDVVVGGTTSLTANFVLDPAAAAGPRVVTVTTAGGTSAPQAFTIDLPAPTLTSVSPSQGIRGSTVAVTLTGTNLVASGTTVIVSGSGVTVTNVIVGSATSLTASFVLDPGVTAGARTVTVTTAGGTSAGQAFTINAPAPGSTTFAYTGGEQHFTVPAGVGSITILATGAVGGKGNGVSNGLPLGMGGRTTATVSVLPGALLTVRVGGSGPDGDSPSTAGGFNGGGASAANGGGVGGASSVRDGSIPLVVAGGGGGGGGATDAIGGIGGHGGGSPPRLVEACFGAVRVAVAEARLQAASAAPGVTPVAPMGPPA